MNSFVSKNELLKSIVPGKGNAALSAAPAQNNVVRFIYTSNLATAATNDTAGGLVFANDGNGHAGIWSGGTMLSSSIQSVTVDAQSSNKHGGKTVTVTYIVAATGAVATTTFNVIDEAGVEAYVTGSDTIVLNSSNLLDVKIKADGGIAVDSSGLYVDLGDVFEVDEKTVGFDNTTQKLKTLVQLAYAASGNAEKPAIQLQDVDGGYLSEVTVEQIIGSGIVDHTEYDSASNILHIYWKNPTGSTAVVTDINLSEILDINDWAVKSDSTDFLSLTTNTSTAEIGVKKATVTYTATSGNTAADLTATTTNGEVVVASTAIPAIKNYVDDVAQNIAVSAEGDSYVNAAVNSTNKKKIDVSANVGELTVTTTAGSDSTIAGVANKLVDGSELATKVSTFVNARISEEVAKLDSSAATADLSTTSGSEVYVKVTGELVDGKFKSTDGMTVATQIAATTKTAYVPASGDTPATDPALVVATAGLATDKDVTNLIGYINDKVQQLQDEEDAIFDHIDSTVSDADSANFISIEVVQVDASLSSATINTSYGEYGTVTRETNGTATFAAATDGLAKVSDTQTFVSGIIQSLDSSLTAETATHDISVYLEEVDGKVTTIGVEHTNATVTFTGASGSTPASLTGQGSFVLGSDIAAIKSYADAAAAAAVNGLDSTVEESDASAYVTVTTGIVDGKLLDASCSVEVEYTALTAAPGAVTVNTNGIATGNDIKTAVEGALTWTVLS